MSSSFQTFIDQPYPIYAAEAAAQPYEPAPVEGVSATNPVRAVEAEELRPDVNDDTAASDATELSNAARLLARDAAREEMERRLEQRDEKARRDESLLDAVRIRNNRSIRELVASFRNYDNSAAAERYNASLDVFSRYGAEYRDSGETGAVANLRAQENDAYLNLGISHAGTVTREVREGISRSIDRWFVGEGVFTPAMLNYPSYDGFMFTPISPAAQAALRSADVLATYERPRIAAYLRELAALTPEDFMFYDPTGLGALSLQQRRDFLARVDQILARERIDARAAELRYSFNAAGEVDLERLGLQDREEIARLERQREEINTYYGQLANSVQQYDAGIVSESLV